MRNPCILAIDQGTTGSTALVLSRRGEPVGRGYAELTQHYPRPGWVEHDADQIWASVRAAVREALGRARAPARSIAAIGLTNQRETVLAWERTGGRPLGRAIVWQDRRTAERCAALRRAGLEPAVRRRTGLVLDPYFSATKLEWMLRSDPTLARRARRGEVAVGTIDSWVLWRLTGGRAHATDPTNASRTLLFDIGRLRWDDGLLERFGVPRAALPEVLPSSGRFGVTRGAPELPDGIPIAGIAGDQQAALFGQGCVSPGQSKNTYGTGCFLLLHTGGRRVASRAGLLTTVACDADGAPAYALEGSVFIAGAAVQWLRDGLGAITTAAESEALARSVPDSGGVTLVPAFVGLGAPHWRADVRGALFGLTRGTTRAHVARATLEAIAHQSADLVEAMARDAGARLGTLRVDGGATANALLMQTQADLLGIPVVRPRVLDTTALGAGLLAGLGIGLWRSHRELDRARRTDRVFRPRHTAAWRRAERARWADAVAMLLAGATRDEGRPGRA